MPKSDPSDSELLADWLKNHREAAFHALVARYAGLVHMVAKRTSGDETLASEASQLTFILLARKAKSLTSRNSLAGWLHLTAVMHSKNLLRQRRRESSKQQLLQSTMEIHQPGQHTDQWKEMQPVLDNALASLSEKDREALLLRFYRALPIKEVAATLGIATDAAQKRIDRATERLRGKLARRGCPTGVSLSAILLGGFSADAQASLPVSFLGSKALAAGKVSAFSLKIVLPNIIALMKSTQIIPPLVALLLAGVFIGTKAQSLSTMEQSNADLRNRIDAAGTRVAARSTASKFISGDRAVDWKRLIEELADPSRSEGKSRALRLFEAYWNSLEPWEMAAGLQEVDALDLSRAERTNLEEFLIDSLLQKDPGLGFSWVVANSREHRHTHTSSSLYRGWAKNDLASATEWLDSEVAAGNFSPLRPEGENLDRTFFESTLMQQLVLQDPAAIERRLAAMSEGQSHAIVDFASGSNDSWLRNLISLDPAEYAKLIHLYLPREEQLGAFSKEAGRILQKNDYPEVTAYLQMIEATPDERAACVNEAVEQKFAKARRPQPFSQNDLDAMRDWVSSETPAAVDEITGKVLASITEAPRNSYHGEPVINQTPFDQAAALAAHYHHLSGNDVILTNFLKSRLVAENLEQARQLAGSIRDEVLRARELENLR